jgi:hypothetical protein
MIAGMPSASTLASGRRPAVAIAGLLALLPVLGAAPLPACADGAQSFASRVARAREIEARKDSADYFNNVMYPAIGTPLATAMRKCLSHAGASTAKFTVVADVTPAGKFVNLAHQPDTDTAACLATALASLRTPPPAGARGDLPIVIDMEIAP